MTLHRDLIIKLAARHKLPAVYYERFFVAAGGLISYGPDFVDQYRRAATYVDRILKGEKPGTACAVPPPGSWPKAPSALCKISAPGLQHHLAADRLR